MKFNVKKKESVYSGYLSINKVTVDVDGQEVNLECIERGFSSALLYVTLGLVGLPIFASGGGIGYIASPTFGFLYGMVIASLFIAYMAKNYFKDNFFKILLSIVIGAVIIFGCGITHLSMFIGISKAFTLGVTPFIYSEILKIALAVFVTYALLKKTKQIN